MNKLKIFVSAYACEPNLGSEIGVGWHWVLEMSKYFELWVLTRESNRHSIEPWIAVHPEHAGIHFLYFDLPKWARFWKKGLRGVRLYYNIWQYETNGTIRKTMQENNIRIFHHLTYGNAMWPVCRYGRKQCFIWGPVSAGVMIPKDFTKHYNLSARIKESIQRALAKTIYYNTSFIHRCKDASLILCKTDKTIESIRDKYRYKCVQFTDVAVGDISIPISPDTNQSENMLYLAAGTLVGWRNFDVLIFAFSKAFKQNNRLRLKIIGDGPEYKRLSRLVHSEKLDKAVVFAGRVSMNDYYLAMGKADVIINPCFREGAVTVSFDSMSLSKPLICFDTGGYTHYFNDSYSRIIKEVNSRSEAINKLSDEILFMADKQKCSIMGKLSHEASKKYTWEQKGILINELITTTFSKYIAKNH